MLILFMMPAKSLLITPSLPFISEASHVFLFAGFSLFFIWDLMNIKSLSRPMFSIYVRAVIYSMLFGIIVELLQALWGSGRSAEFFDVVFDVIGSLLSVGVIALYFLLCHQGKATD